VNSKLNLDSWGGYRILEKGIRNTDWAAGGKAASPQKLFRI